MRWLGAFVLGFGLGILLSCVTLTEEESQKRRDCSRICWERLGSQIVGLRVTCVREAWLYTDGLRTVELCVCRCYSVETW